MSPILVFVVILLSKAVCIDTSVLTKENACLENSLFAVTSASSILDCAVDCSSNSESLFFGFEPATRTCYQHVQNSATGTNEMEVKKNWSHRNISLRSKTVLGPCSYHSCKKGDRYMIYSITKAPKCVKAKVSPQPGYCQAPVVIPNAKINSGKQQKGSVRIYTCNHGYLDTSRDSTSGATTCMADGQWHKVQLNCSGPYIKLETPNLPTQKFFPIPPETLHVINEETLTLIFLVRTCKDSHFLLSGKSNYDSIIRNYHVIIGGWGNTLSAIRKCKCFKSCPNEVEYHRRGILSCEEFRPFWLSWKNGTICVGKGRKPGDQMFMIWRAQGLSAVNNISISSYIRNKGTWLFIPQI